MTYITKYKKILVIFIVLLIVISYSVNNINVNKSNSKTLIKGTNNKSFAYFLQENNDYKEYKTGTIPTGYKINYNKTKCYDYKNNEVTANTTISMNKNKLSVLSSKTVYCTVYLDKQKGDGTPNNPYQIEYIEDLVELSNEVNSGTDYSGMYFALSRNLDFNTIGSYRSYNSRAYGDINNNGKVEAIKTELTTGDGFIPIGSEDNQFMGNWERAGGGFYTLDGLLVLNLYSIRLNPSDWVNAPTSSSTLKINEWYTLIGTYDGTNIKIYINGQEELNSRTPLTGNIKSSPAPIILGGNPDVTLMNLQTTVVNPSYTTFSDVLIFDRALTADEISKDYKDIPNPTNKTELLLWYQF